MVFLKASARLLVTG